MVLDRERDQPGLEPPVADGVGDLDRVLAHDADAHPRMALAEVLDQPAEQVVMRGAERAEGDGAALQGADLADGLRGLLGRAERPLGLGLQHPARLGQHEPPARAREERDAELGLQPADLVGEARLRHQQRLGGGRERSVLGGGEEVAELLQSHRLCLLILKSTEAGTIAHLVRY